MEKKICETALQNVFYLRNLAAWCGGSITEEGILFSTQRRRAFLLDKILYLELWKTISFLFR